MYTAVLILGGLLCLLLREELRYRRLAERERERSGMLAILSHQMRTPLTTCKWYADLLLKHDIGPLNATQEEFVAKIAEANESAVQLFTRFMEISRAERHTKIQCTSVDARACMSRAVHALESIWKEKQQHVSVEGSAPCPVSADPILLYAIFDALLSNAIRYTSREGGISITLEQKDPYVKVSIADTGVGIPPAERGKIFRGFFRGSQAQSLYSQGNGLSMYFVKRMLESMNGSITFVSVQGRGTVFFITLQTASEKGSTSSVAIPKSAFKKPSSRA